MNRELTAAEKFLHYELDRHQLFEDDFDWYMDDAAPRVWDILASGGTGRYDYEDLFNTAGRIARFFGTDNLDRWLGLLQRAGRAEQR